MKFLARSDFSRRKLRRFHDADAAIDADAEAVDVGGVDERLLKMSAAFFGRFLSKTSESQRPRLKFETRS